MSKPIVFLMHRFRTGGVEKVFINLAKQLISQPIRLVLLNNDVDEILKDLPENVSLMCFEDCKPVVWAQAALLKYPKLAPILKVIALVAQFFYLRKSFKNQDFEIVNFSDTLSTLVLSNHSRRKPYSWIHVNPEIISQSRFAFLYRALYGRCKNIVCICNDQKILFHHLFRHIPYHRLKVVYNSIDVEKIDQLSTTPLPKDVDPNYFLMVARLDQRSKDFVVVINAYAGLIHEGIQLPKLYIIGTGPDFEAIQGQINSYNMSNQILLLGNKSNPYPYMKHADLFIFSSKSEGFGLVLLEAMCCRVPIIATDCKVGPAEILEGGKLGWLISPGNVEEMVAAIRNFVHNRFSYSPILTHARQRAEIFDLKNNFVKGIFD